MRDAVKTLPLYAALMVKGRQDGKRQKCFVFIRVRADGQTLQLKPDRKLVFKATRSGMGFVAFYRAPARGRWIMRLPTETGVNRTGTVVVE